MPRGFELSHLWVEDTSQYPDHHLEIEQDLCMLDGPDPGPEQEQEQDQDHHEELDSRDRNSKLEVNNDIKQDHHIFKLESIEEDKALLTASYKDFSSIGLLRSHSTSPQRFLSYINLAWEDEHRLALIFLYKKTNDWCHTTEMFNQFFKHYLETHQINPRSKGSLVSQYRELKIGMCHSAINFKDIIQFGDLEIYTGQNSDDLLKNLDKYIRSFGVCDVQRNLPTRKLNVCDNRTLNQAQTVNLKVFPRIMFRFFNKDSQGENSYKGFTSGSHDTRLEPNTDPWIQAIQNHLQRVPKPTPFISITSSFIWALHKAISSKDSSASIAILDLTSWQERDKSIYHARPFCQSIGRKNRSYRYRGNFEYLVYGKIPPEMIITIFSIEQLQSILSPQLNPAFSMFFCLHLFEQSKNIKSLRQMLAQSPAVTPTFVIEIFVQQILAVGMLRPTDVSDDVVLELMDIIVQNWELKTGQGSTDSLDAESDDDRSDGDDYSS